jgi:hypothetical protein
LTGGRHRVRIFSRTTPNTKAATNRSDETRGEEKPARRAGPRLFLSALISCPFHRVMKLTSIEASIKLCSSPVFFFFLALFSKDSLKYVSGGKDFKK